MRPTRGLALALLPTLLLAVGCAPTDESKSSSSSTSSPSPSSATSAGASCATGDLPLKKPGTLTIGTDSPAYDPWFAKDDPTNGRGFESAVAYAVAKQLGFPRAKVTWVKVPFNSSYAPGAKTFDLDINQISITAARAKVVDFSDGYYSAAQAVIALKGSKAAGITSLAALKDLKLGAQTGTTSLSAISDVIKPKAQPLVYDDTNQAKQSLLNGQVQAILADLPTAFYITAAEIPKGTIVGQFQPETGQQEKFGMLLEKGSKLTPCVDTALAALKKDGTLAGLEKRWLSDVVDVPVLK